MSQEYDCGKISFVILGLHSNNIKYDYDNQLIDILSIREAGSYTFIMQASLEFFPDVEYKDIEFKIHVRETQVC